MNPVDPHLVTRFGALTADQVAALDEAAVAVGVDVPQLMEHAGLQVARSAWSMLDERPAALSVVAGRGNNGGDGAVAARLLSGWGCRVTLHVLAEKAALRSLLQRHVAAARACDVEVAFHGPTAQLDSVKGDLLIDAVFGTGLRAAPRSPQIAALHAMNSAPTPVLSVDVPSGLDASTGRPFDGCVRATRTCTLAAMKAWLWSPAARSFAGDLFVADIGMPIAAWRAIGMAPPSEVVAGRLLPVPSSTV